MSEQQAGGSLLEQWAAAGGDRCMLPSGISVQVELPNLLQLILRGGLPQHLRAIATEFAGEGIEVSAMSEQEQANLREFRRIMAAGCVRAVRLPDSEDWQPYRLEPADLERLPDSDVEQLEYLALHLRTPRQVDALSRLVNGQLEDEEAKRIVEEEAAESIEGWVPFRELARGPNAIRDGAPVRAAPVGPADHLGPGGRVRPRRGAGAGAARRGRRSKRAKRG